MPAWSLAVLYWAWPNDGLEGATWILTGEYCILEECKLVYLRFLLIILFEQKVRDMQEVLRPEAHVFTRALKQPE